MPSFQPLSGIVAAPVLPMRPDQSIDWASLESYLASIAADKPTAIAMNMDASEVHSLTRDEQLEVIRISRSAIGGGCPLFSGLIAGSTREALGLAEALVKAGAEGLTVFPVFPYFVGDALDPSVVHGYFKAIADAGGCAISGFRMRTMADWSFETLSALADIPEFIGFKDSTNQLGEMARTFAALSRLPRKIGVLTGNDPVIYEVMVLGCDGAFIGFAGTLTADLVEMHRLVAAKDIAAASRVWDRIGPLARYCWRTPLRDYRARMKELLVMQGKIGSAALRLPALGIDEAERAELRQLAMAAGALH